MLSGEFILNKSRSTVVRVSRCLSFLKIYIFSTVLRDFYVVTLHRGYFITTLIWSCLYSNNYCKWFSPWIIITKMLIVKWKRWSLKEITDHLSLMRLVIFPLNSCVHESSNHSRIHVATLHYTYVISEAKFNSYTLKFILLLHGYMAYGKEFQSEHLNIILNTLPRRFLIHYYWNTGFLFMG